MVRLTWYQLLMKIKRSINFRKEFEIYIFIIKFRPNLKRPNIHSWVKKNCLLTGRNLQTLTLGRRPSALTSWVEKVNGAQKQQRENSMLLTFINVTECLGNMHASKCIKCVTLYYIPQNWGYYGIISTAAPDRSCQCENTETIRGRIFTFGTLVRYHWGLELISATRWRLAPPSDAVPPYLIWLIHTNPRQRRNVTSYAFLLMSSCPA